MAINNVCFTYPVLSNFSDDYINVHFIAGSVGMLEKTRKYSYIKTKVEIDDKNINHLIDNNLAKIIVKIYCRSTKYRTIFEIKRGIDEIKILNTNVNNNVELNTFIVANKRINNFSSKNFGPDYKGRIFELEKGNIIAIGKVENIFIEKDINDLTKLNSVIKICDSEEKNVPLKVYFDDEVIKILLASEDYRIYSQYSKYSTNIFNSMIIIPALTFILDKLSDDNIDITDYENKKWYRVLSKKLSALLGKEFKIDYLKTQDSLTLVQKLFDNVLSDAFKDIEKRHEGEK